MASSGGSCPLGLLGIGQQASSMTVAKAQALIGVDALVVVSRQGASSAVPERKSWSIHECSVEAAPTRDYEHAQNYGCRNLGDLPEEIVDSILAKLDYKTLFQVKAVSKLFKARIEGNGFRCCRESQHPREGRLTSLHFTVREDGVWRCHGYDLDTDTWMKLPPFEMLPRLDTNVFRDHFICGDRGLLCVCVSAVQSSSLTFRDIPGKMVVFNPLTGARRELPPLNHPRHPVLLHMVVDSTGDSFRIIAAGSAASGAAHLSKITEVFDSRTSAWMVAENVPGPYFALNEYQNGASKDGILFCIALLDGDRGRGLLAFSVAEEKWLSHLSCPLRIASNIMQVANINGEISLLRSASNSKIMQVANINGEIVVFLVIEHNPPDPRRAVLLEIEHNPHDPRRIVFLQIEHNSQYPRTTVEHRIDRVVWPSSGVTNSGEGSARGPEETVWRTVMTEMKVGSRAGLLVYPEFCCVPFAESRLCIHNTSERTGVVYEIASGNRAGGLRAPTWEERGEMNFYTLNPPTFTFEPNFKGNRALGLTERYCVKVRF